MKVVRRMLAAVAALCSVATAAVAATITPGNVASLALKWDFPLPVAVSSNPVVVDGVVYATSWDATLYALDAHSGSVLWSYAAGASLQSTVVPTPDGGLCFGDSIARVHCVDAGSGELRWLRPVNETDKEQIWSGLGLAAGRLFVGIASQTDNPCSQGRMTALDLATGDELWTVRAVPARICDTDTSIVCTSDADCDGGSCIMARGAGVTAQPVADASGRYVYMNTVGCYTFPSVGDSDSVFKVDAETGEVIWKTRVDAPEQFGFCANDPSVDCGSTAMCAAVGGECTIPKAAYHDFGFLNGPLLVEVDDGEGARTLVISGSKNGSLYAFDEATGDIVWRNAVQPTPVTPGFAGFGLFNGAIAHADGRIYAALGSLIPARVCAEDLSTGCRSDGDCEIGACLPAPDHLMAFDARDGSVIWSADDIGPSWAHVGVIDGIVYSGAGTFSGGPTDLFAYDAADGTLLARFPMPANVISRPTVVGDSLYVGYGIAFPGGLRAFSLCGNGSIDEGETCDDGGETASCNADCTSAACGDGKINASAGEECDDKGETPDCDGDCTLVACGDGRVNATAGEQCEDGNTAAGDCCGPSCRYEAPSAPCGDDGSACTRDLCDGGGVCEHPIADVECYVGEIAGAVECPGETVPKKLAKLVRKKAKRSQKLLAKAAKLDTKGKVEKATGQRGKARKQLDAIFKQTAKAADRQQLSAECRSAIDALVTSRVAAIEAAGQ